MILGFRNVILPAGSEEACRRRRHHRRREARRPAQASGKACSGSEGRHRIYLFIYRCGRTFFGRTLRIFSALATRLASFSLLSLVSSSCWYRLYSSNSSGGISTEWPGNDEEDKVWDTLCVRKIWKKGNSAKSNIKKGHFQCEEQDSHLDRTLHDLAKRAKRQIGEDSKIYGNPWLSPVLGMDALSFNQIRLSLQRASTHVF